MMKSETSIPQKAPYSLPVNDPKIDLKHGGEG